MRYPEMLIFTDIKTGFFTDLKKRRLVEMLILSEILTNMILKMITKKVIFLENLIFSENVGTKPLFQIP